MKPIRGTYDLFDKEIDIYNYVINELIQITKQYSYKQIKTPILEETELFKRTSGEESDIAQKEMYEFLDKGGREVSMRPELTAGTVRAYLTNKIYGKRLNQYKFFYFGEAFRYERPQSGRFRQFHQFGIEYFNEDSIYSDVEVISLAFNLIKHFELNKDVELKINTIGTIQERANYNKALQYYFQENITELCEDCQRRLKTNPLRILDCKIDKNNEILKNTPKLKEYLKEETNSKFQKILDLLTDLKIDYTVDNNLVRGLDYYNDIVFEFVYKQDKTLIGGGRYDGLVEQLGGSPTPAIGFGIGIERLIEAIKETTPEIFAEVEEVIDIYYVDLSLENYNVILQSMDKLRMQGITCFANYSKKSLKSSYKEAEKNKCIYMIILNEDYSDTKQVVVKNLQTKEEINTTLQNFEKDIIDG